MPYDTPDEPVSAIETSDGITPTAPTIRRTSRRRAFAEWVIILVVAVSVSMLVRTYVVAQFSIPSGSMEPTLNVGDRILVDKLSVAWGSINRGDIVVFRHPPKALTTCAPPVEPIFIKRVIGLPGDVLTSKGSTIYVDGKALKQTWQTTSPFGPLSETESPRSARSAARVRISLRVIVLVCRKSSGRLAKISTSVPAAVIVPCIRSPPC